jgi:hypothetical protein
MTPADRNWKKVLQWQLSRIPFFLFILPFFFILSGYNDYFGFFTFRFAGTNFLILTGAIFASYFIVTTFIANKPKAVLITFFLWCSILFFGFLHDSAKRIIPGPFFTSYTFFLPFFVSLCIIGVRIIQRSKLGFTQLFQYLNCVFFVLFFFEVIRFILQFPIDPDRKLIDARYTAYQQFQNSKTAIPDSQKPDIFLLLFDGMPSSNALSSDLAFDNRHLDSFLSGRGFYVAPHSKSNYDLTVLSMSSMFNMDYVPTTEINTGNGIEMYFRSTSSLISNSLSRALTNEGYQLFNYQPLSIFNNEDWEGRKTFGRMLTKNYFYRTLPGRILRDLSWNRSKTRFFDRAQQNAYVQNASLVSHELNWLTQKVKERCSSETTAPKFVYGHFMVPHSPYIFTETGNIQPFSVPKNLKNGKTKETDLFVQQVAYTGSVIKELVTYILANNRRNTIVIVQGDHGYTSAKTGGDFGCQNLTAIYFPDKDYRQLYPTLSPVNTFRVILNKNWGAKLPLLSDSCVLLRLKTIEGAK